MKKLLYIIITLVILLGIGAWLKTQKTETITPNVITEVEKQPIVKEDEHGNMTVDGEVVEDVKEDMPEDTGGDEETIVNE